MVAFAEDVFSILTNDYYGTPISNLKLMQRVTSHEDIDLVIDAGGHDPEILSDGHLRMDWLDPEA